MSQQVTSTTDLVLKEACNCMLPKNKLKSLKKKEMFLFLFKYIKDCSTNTALSTVAGGQMSLVMNLGSSLIFST